MGHVSADLALGPLDPLLDLREVLIDQLRPAGSTGQLTAGSSPLDVTLDRVVRAASQLTGITKRPGQVVGIQDFHDLLGRLQLIPSWERSGALAPLIGPEEGASTADPQQGRRHRVGQIP